MSTVNVFQAKTTPSKILEKIETGAEKEITIPRHGRPVAVLSRVTAPKPAKRIGTARGRFEVPDSIDEDNPAIARLFRGKGP